ncbi:uncharacterized protein LOC129769332 isoform X2 [Toxorhynchites rutilus septentrionalis]|uniref:uncharacterized protein LOC129769332 isoform X2 n=1 Tax=Toxorhynchites rutilus septentrionalis TaxID=329112 RepID=UPI00247A6802|nr:uncharacterized protein LOC129769332 isoform X2 [Toxorhynchites rutilus septentrionalis]
MDLACNRPLTFSGSDFGATFWLFLHSNTVLKSREDQNKIFLELFETLDLTVNSEVLYVIQAQDHYEIRKVFKYSSLHPSANELFGYWKEGHFIQLNLSAQVNTIRRWNLHGVKLNALVICGPEDSSATKVSTALTATMAIMLNTTTNFRCIKSWDNELLNFLQTDINSLGVTPDYMTPERLKYVRFLTVTGPTDYKFIFRSPKLSYTDNVFALSFHKQVWLSILMTILLASILQMIIFRLKTQQSESKNNLDGFSGVLLNMISIVSQLDSLDNSRSVSSRTLNVVMLISLMFLYICFSASIIALIQSPSDRIRTLEDLLHSGMQLAAQNSSINLNFMKMESELYRTQIYKRIASTNDFVPLNEGADRIRAGLYAFHGVTSQVYQYMSEYYGEDEKCNLQTINFLRPLDGYYAIGKKSPFLEHVKIGLLKLQEFGYQGRAIATSYTRKPRCIGDSVFVPISMIDAKFAIELVAFSMVLVLAILGCEMLEFRCHILKRSRIWIGEKSLIMKKRIITKHT